jgi:hypothetical protein
VSSAAPAGRKLGPMGWIAPSCERCIENAPRLAQLEKIAELARTVLGDLDAVRADAVPQPLAQSTFLLRLALVDLDNHPNTRRDPRESE